MRIFSLCLILICCLDSSAQEKQIKFQNISEISFVYGGQRNYYNNTTFKPTIINGINYKDRLFVGIATSFFGFNEYDLFDLSFDLRYDLLQKLHTPFVFFETGYVLPLSNPNSEYYYNFKSGYSYNIGLGIKNQLNDRIALLSKIGYQYYHFTTEFQNYNDDSLEQIYDLNRIFVSFGLAFK